MKMLLSVVALAVALIAGAAVAAHLAAGTPAAADCGGNC